MFLGYIGAVCIHLSVVCRRVTWLSDQPYVTWCSWVKKLLTPVSRNTSWKTVYFRAVIQSQRHKLWSEGSQLKLNTIFFCFSYTQTKWKQNGNRVNAVHAARFEKLYNCIWMKQQLVRLKIKNSTLTIKNTFKLWFALTVVWFHKAKCIFIHICWHHTIRTSWVLYNLLMSES